VTVNYATEGVTAYPEMDFMATSGTLTFAPGEISKNIEVPLVCDTLKESDETFNMTLSAATNGNISKASGVGTIRNDDTYQAVSQDGYTTPESYPGMTKLWGDEFDGTILDATTWTHEVNGNGGGNNELQYYTNSSENSRVNNGNLIIEAKAQNYSGKNYTSARIISKGKKEFMYGRVDIRAKMPEGQGLWPALWMLGANIDQVSWPTCGEIDVMELLGQSPNTVHGTVHYATSAGVHGSFGTASYLSGGKKFSDEFHVFSLIWSKDDMRILVDDKQYFSTTSAGLGTTKYPFNAPFFMIMNVAVGGNWPGSPDATTVFPQQMHVDYVRVFQ